MAVKEQHAIPLADLAHELNLPVPVLRHFVDKHHLAEPRRYPNQRRVVRAARLPELRRRLRQEGYDV